MAASKPNWWQVFGNAAQLSSALIALLGFAAVLLQLNEIRNNNRSVSARQVYLAYADLEFRNPQFAEPDFERIKRGDAETRTRYESFVAFLLYACEEALIAFASQREWIRSCDADMKVHLPYLCEKTAADSGYIKSYGDRMQSFVKEAMARYGVSAPDCRIRKT